MLDFCEWLASTSWSISLHESLHMYPLVESAHVLTLPLFVGLAAMLDLRLLGLTMRHVPVTEVLRRLLPWITIGFIVMVITGSLLFYAIPVRTFQNVFFRFKVIFLILAGANVWVFHSGAYRSIASWANDPIPPRGARMAGILSLAFWALIIVCGRMIAYNWFDCDLQPQPALVNWWAGCVVDSARSVVDSP